MKSGYLTIIFSGLLLLLGACKESPEAIVQHDLEQGIALSGFDNLLDKPYLMIIPRIGCMGCISAAEQFMLEAYRPYRDQLNILLSDISSYKTARVRFGSAFMDAANVFVDRESVFNEGEFESTYPLILKLDKREVIEVNLVSPENALALENFKNALDTTP